MHSIDSTVTRLALSLWSSGKRVERLPRVTEYLPYETVQIVAMPFELAGTMIVNRFEAI